MRIVNKIILGIPGIPFISVEIQSKAASNYLPVEKSQGGFARIIEYRLEI